MHDTDVKLYLAHSTWINLNEAFEWKLFTI